MKNKPHVRAVSRINLNDAELRILVTKIMEIDPRSLTITQALRNAAVSYFKELVKEGATK